ncbi:MAG: poly-beta-hydroxybutyrate polymerase, partial [Minwuiales bacterium]|nr:poly-beta-hydroxybutyrate polymerase [Minwuiales bacterium]
IRLLTDADVTFLLTKGGHNAGIVSEPGHPRRHFRISHQTAESRYVDPDTWLMATDAQEGSWWPAWEAWLTDRSSGMAAPPEMGAPDGNYPPLYAAPGEYVMRR